MPAASPDPNTNLIIYTLEYTTAYILLRTFHNDSQGQGKQARLGAAAVLRRRTLSVSLSLNSGTRTLKLLHMIPI